MNQIARTQYRFLFIQCNAQSVLRSIIFTNIENLTPS